MSRVTNIILSVEVLTDPLKTIDPLNEWLFNKYRSFLERVDNHAGGNKEMEVDIWMGAFNYFQVHELEEKVRDWGIDISLMVQEQEDTHFTVIKF